LPLRGSKMSKLQAGAEGTGDGVVKRRTASEESA
jgi:hypothetical protein